jgi:hypothetical protein
MHLSIVGLPHLWIVYIYRQAFNKLVFERGKGQESALIQVVTRSSWSRFVIFGGK